MEDTIRISEALLHADATIKIVDTAPASLVLTGDSLKLINKISRESIDLTVSSPPYCMGKDYESTTNIQDFVRNHELLLPKIIEKTKQGGSICWQVGYHVQNGVITPLDYLVHKVMSDFPEMKLRNRIIWHFGHGTHSPKRFSGRHEVILWYSKGDDYFFDLDAVRVPQKYPGKKHYKGPKKGKYSGNPLGKNPSDVWEIPNVNAMHVEKTAHPCQYPIGMVLRLVKSLCPEGGWVFDPFAGSGSTGAGTIIAGRNFIGIEKQASYARIARKRIQLALAGKLDYRSANIPILDPATAGAVGQAPRHFASETNR